jgi:hypothetical protein
LDKKGIIRKVNAEAELQELYAPEAQNVGRKNFRLVLFCPVRAKQN